MEQKNRLFSKNLFRRILLGICICMVACLWNTKPAQAYVSDKSYLYVAGTYMVRYGENRGIMMVKGERGTAVYNEAANTLTLTDFKVTHDEPIVTQYMPGLKIILKGTNELKSEMAGICIRKNDVTICGNGTLNISSGTKDKRGIAIETGGDLYIQDCTLNVTASSNPVLSHKGIAIKNSTVTIKRTGVDELNDPGITNGLYNRKFRFSALAAESLEVSSSKLDMTGINYALGVESKPVLDSNAVVTDGDGIKLKLTKLCWPEIFEAYPDTTTFEYVYSKSTKDMIFSFDEAENRVIIKNKAVPSKPDTPVTPGKPDTPDKPDTPVKPSTPDTSKVKGTFKVGNLYFTGTPASRKMSCTGLVNKKSTSVTIPATVRIKGYTCKVTSIGKKAFKNCTSLKTVKIGSNVTSIGAEAFCNCKRLKSLTFGKNVATIGEKSFYKCSALTKVTFPSKTKTIKKGAFAYCTGLRTVQTGNGVTSIGADAFSNCKKLTSLSLGRNITVISDRAFYKCSALTKVTIPSKTKTIKKETFANCTSLKTVKTGNGVTSIGTGAFYNCKKLTSVSLGKNVTTISDKAFYKCSALPKVTFGTKIKYIKKNAFANCTRLKTITIKGKSLRPVSSGAFKSTKSRVRVNLPKSKYSSYRRYLKGAGLKNPVYRKQ